MDPGVDLVHIYTSMEGDTGESNEFETTKKYMESNKKCQSLLKSM